MMIVLLGVIAAAAQPRTGAVAGRVLNSATGNYVLSARVSVKGTDLVVLTDATGGYELDQVPAGPVTLRVLHPGLAEEERTVEVRAGVVTAADFNLTGRMQPGRQEE